MLVNVPSWGHPLGNVDVTDVDAESCQRLPDNALFLMHAYLNDTIARFQSVRSSEQDTESYCDPYASTLIRVSRSTKVTRPRQPLATRSSKRPT